MASPQAENGHTDIANEIMEKLALTHLSGNEWKILFVVLRQTWGWHKKIDKISITQFEKKTGMSRASVVESINRLVGKSILLVGKKGLVNEYHFNKDYDEWVVGKKGLVGKSVETSREKGTGRWSVKRDTQKKILQKKLTKETISKDIGGKPQSELQDLIDFSKDKNFPIQGTIKMNRYNASNLLKKFGLEKSKKLVLAAVDCRGKPYAPQVNDFIQLYRKCGDLVNFYTKEKNVKRGYEI